MLRTMFSSGSAIGPYLQGRGSCAIDGEASSCLVSPSSFTCLLHADIPDCQIIGSPGVYAYAHNAEFLGEKAASGQ